MILLKSFSRRCFGHKKSYLHFLTNAPWGNRSAEIEYSQKQRFTALSPRPCRGEGDFQRERESAKVRKSGEGELNNCRHFTLTQFF